MISLVLKRISETCLINITWGDTSNGGSSKDRRLILDADSVARLFDSYHFPVDVLVARNSGWEFGLDVKVDQANLFYFSLKSLGYSNRVRLSPTHINYALIDSDKPRAVGFLADWFIQDVFPFLKDRGFRWFEVPHVVNENSEQFWMLKVGDFKRDDKSLRRRLD